MKVRLTEAALMNMVKNAVMEVIKEGTMNEYFFANMDKQKAKKSCPVVDKACYPVADKKGQKTKKSCPVVDKACYQVSKKKNEPKEKEQMNEWLGFPGMDPKDIEKAVTDPEKDKKATNKKSTDKKPKKTSKKQ